MSDVGFATKTKAKRYGFRTLTIDDETYQWRVLAKGDNNILVIEPTGKMTTISKKAVSMKLDGKVPDDPAYKITPNMLTKFFAKKEMA